MDARHLPDPRPRCTGSSDDPVRRGPPRIGGHLRHRWSPELDRLGQVLRLRLDRPVTKPTRITGTYRMNDDEFIQVSVVIDSNYPDAIAEAKATMLTGTRDMLADVIRQTRPEVE